MKRKKNDILSIKAAMEATKTIVYAWHAGTLAPPSVERRVAKNKVRWTPFFRSDKGPTNYKSVPYTARAVSEHLGNTYKSGRTINAHPSVILALLLLELLEKNRIDETILAKVFSNQHTSIKELLHEAAVLNRETKVPA